MNVLQKTVLSLLREGKIEDLQKKYPKLNVQEISKNDPTSQKKYLQWMCKQLALGVSESDLYPSIKFFDKNQSKFQKKDISAYKTLKELEDIIKSLPEKSKSQQREEVKGNAPKIYEDSNVVIVRPDDKNSCITYGKGTKWCITMKDASYYEQYTSENVIFYFVISKKLEQDDPRAKIALAVIRKNDNSLQDVDVYDAEDNQLSTFDVDDKFLELCRADAIKRPKSLYAKIISNEASRDEIIKIIHGKTDEANFLRMSVAENQNTQPDILDMLANDENDEVREAVARNSNTTINSLLRLASDERRIVRYAVTENENVTSEILEKLFQNLSDGGDPVAIELAKNEKTSVKILEKLFETSEVSHMALALNPNTPQEILEKFINNGETDTNFNTHYSILGNVAENPSATKEMLVKLSYVDIAYVRVAVAENKNTPKNVLVRLSVDTAHGVRERVAQNPNTPIEILVRFASEKFPKLRAGVAHNISAPVEVLDKLSKDENSTVRKNVASNPSTSSETLMRLVSDHDYNVVYNICHNQNVTREILISLANSDSSMVRRTAKNALERMNKNEALIRAYVSTLI